MEEGPIGLGLSQWHLDYTNLLSFKREMGIFYLQVKFYFNFLFLIFSWTDSTLSKPANKHILKQKCVLRRASTENPTS